jgi:hypothetical protein
VAAQGTCSRRQLDRGEIWLGTPLPGPICNQRGRILVRGGQILAAKERDGLPKELWVGPEWPQTPPSPPPCEPDPGPLRPGHEVVDELLQRRGVSPGPDKRGCARHAYRVLFRVVLQERHGGALKERAIQVVTNDISRTGFSFFYRNYVAVGTSLWARFDDLPNRPTVLGVVRNCFLVAGRKHRIGVQFLERS